MIYLPLFFSSSLYMFFSPPLVLLLSSSCLPLVLFFFTSYLLIFFFCLHWSISPTLSVFLSSSFYLFFSPPLLLLLFFTSSLHISISSSFVFIGLLISPTLPLFFASSLHLLSSSLPLIHLFSSSLLLLISSYFLLFFTSQTNNVKNASTLLPCYSIVGAIQLRLLPISKNFLSMSLSRRATFTVDHSIYFISHMILKSLTNQYWQPSNSVVEGTQCKRTKQESGK